jgi:long-chain acyl-CoA synthetase
MRVEDFLRDSARRLPSKTALVAGKRRLSFAELDVMSDRLAAALADRGIGRGDRVVVFMENSFEAVVAIVAVLKAGAAFTPIDPSMKSDELAFILDNWAVAGIITQARLAGTTGAAVARAGSVKLVVLAGAGCAPAGTGCLSFEAAIATTADAPDDFGVASEPAMLVWTSESRRFADGVTMTHQSAVAAVTSIATCLAACESDVILSALPLSCQYGLYQALMTLKVGATLVLENSFTIPMIFNRIAAEKVTGLPLVPAMEAILLRKGLEPRNFPHLRYITTSGPLVTPAHIARLRELFPTARLSSIYDLSPGRPDGELEHFRLPKHVELDQERPRPAPVRGVRDSATSRGGNGQIKEERPTWGA